MVAMAVLGIVVIALYAGINSGFYSVRLSRENLRATQIMLEKMEGVRVCTWEQVNSNGFISPTFTALYCPETTSGGPVYNGQIQISNIPGVQLNAAYHHDMRQVTINIKWNSGNQDHTRYVTTYFSRYGIQSCLFN